VKILKLIKIKSLCCFPFQKQTKAAPPELVYGLVGQNYQDDFSPAEQTHSPANSRPGWQTQPQRDQKAKQRHSQATVGFVKHLLGAVHCVL